jgi:hypothetical protein
MKKMLIGMLLCITCATAHAGAGWSTQRLLDQYGSPDQTTVTHWGLGNYDWGVCDVYQWANDGYPRTAYILRSDWGPWKAGTVCYEDKIVANDDPRGDANGIISQFIFGQDGIYETVFMPPNKPTHRVIHLQSEARRRDEKAQKDTEDLKKFEEETEKRMTHLESDAKRKDEETQKDIDDLKKFEEKMGYPQ